MGAWEKENTEEALKRWNLEQVIDAKLKHKREPNMVTMEEFVAETYYANRVYDTRKLERVLAYTYP